MAERVIMEGLFIDGMAAFRTELRKALGIQPAQLSEGNFAEDLRDELKRLKNPPREVLWKDFWISCRKMRHTLVPVKFDYIILPPGHSNMMRDAVNGHAEMQAAQHWKDSQEPLDNLLKEFERIFAMAGLTVVYE